MSRPRLLDLFCGAGGASEGYHRAGFHVIGVDINPQPNYPFEFYQDDALEFPVNGVDAIHASPPCQRFSVGAAKWGTQANHPDLVDVTRNRISHVPYVIENIPRAPLRCDVELCGVMFDLGVFRHRWFESNGPLQSPLHPQHPGRIGDGRFHTVTGHAGGSSRRDGWRNGGTAQWRVAMGIDWMTGRELVEAIPPAYTEFIGRQLLAHLRSSTSPTS